MKKWYLVQTQPSNETSAAFNLVRQGYQIYLPQYVRARRHARRLDKVKRPLFPSYMFVKIDVMLQPWRRINSTIGVSRLVCFGEKPIAVPLEIIDAIKTREDHRGLVSLGHLIKYKTGDSVKVIEGALSELTGIFETARDDERVSVLLKLLGREVSVTLPMASIEALA